jgi:hypothetical protein
MQTPLQLSERIIQSRFNTSCMHCGNSISEGEQVVYHAMLRKVRHPDCTLRNHRAWAKNTWPTEEPDEAEAGWRG